MPPWLLPIPLLLAAAMLASLIRKASGAKSSMALRARLGVTSGLWTVAAIAEGAAAIGLIAGLWWPPLGVAAALGTALLMLAALAAHARVGLAGHDVVAPAALLALSVIAASGFATT